MPEQTELITRQMLLPMLEQTFLKKRMILSMPLQIRQIEKQPLLLHLIELTRELYRDNVNDSKIREALEEKKLDRFAARLMQVLSQQTLLDEGYMPVDLVSDRGTRKINLQISQMLKI